MTAWTRTVDVHHTDDGLFIPHADCLLCDPTRAVSHDGPHEVPIVPSGVAVCPAQAYIEDDDISDELPWHALEGALEEAGLLKHARAWDPRLVAVALAAVRESEHRQVSVSLPGLIATFDLRSDRHLQESDPVVELSCTLAPA